jgi:hypothetical protein
MFTRKAILCLAVTVPIPLQLWAEDRNAVTPLLRAHAHNDYHHPRPLLDALDRGFCSIEADIFLVDGQLLVGHAPNELRKERTLQGLYLDPLRQRVRQNAGRVYRNGPEIMLLIDIKTDGKRVYATLREVLASYGDILSSVEKGAVQRRAVQVVISGDRPKSDIALDDPRYAGIDGRLSDLDSEISAHLMPLISDRWSSHFRWRGEGEFPTEERDKLRSIVQRAHAAGRRVRFWAIPENSRVWRELVTVGVDHLNTDQLDELRDFLLQN